MGTAQRVPRPGHASEIGREGLVFAKEVLASHAVVSFTERHNIASRRVMERIGMIYTGEILWRGLVEGRVEEQDDRAVRRLCDQPG